MVELGCMKGWTRSMPCTTTAPWRRAPSSSTRGHVLLGSAWTLDVRHLRPRLHPHKGLDAIREAVRIIEDMDYIVAKRTSPFSPAVFGCGMINGGTIPNAIADHVQARGTIRAMDAETDQILKNSFRDIIAQSELRGFKTTMVHAGYPAVENHPRPASACNKPPRRCCPATGSTQRASP